MPNGSWMAQLPVVGPLIGEIQRGDTLYHPDAYAHFTVAASGQQVASSMHSSQHHSADTLGEPVSQPLADSSQVVDSWAMAN